MSRFRFAVLGFAGLLSVSAVGLAAEQPAQRPGFELGVFHPAPAVTLYLTDTGPANLTVTVNYPANASDEHVLIRLFDQEERLLAWHRLESPLLDRGVLKPAVLKLKLAPKGVQQLRIVAGSGLAAIQVSADRRVKFGVSYQNGRFTPWESGARTYYFQRPAAADSLHLIGGPAKVIDDQGRVLLSTTSKQDTAEARWDNRDQDSICTLRVESAPWNFQAWGFPLILCATPELASELHASVDRLNDGTIITHAFQRRIAAILPSLVAPERVGQTAALLTPWRAVEGLSGDEYAAALNLFSPYSALMAVPRALQGQNLDPRSPRAGLIGVRNEADDAKIWDSFILRDEMWGGLSPRGMEAEGLAFAASLDAPFNPYFGKTPLFFRAAAASLRDLMALGADEVWPTAEIEANPYPGFMAFPMGQKNLRAFYFAAPNLPPDVREVWADALRHVIDRTYPSSLTSARNQSSHYALAYAQFAAGSGLAQYRELARDYAERFAASASAPGYFMEADGPDASYTGMTHWHLAWTQRILPDSVLLEAIRRSYSFWNHTVAPEPDGRMLGASNLSHRTAGSFVEEQWEGARGILDDVLPEVALWAHPGRDSKIAFAQFANVVAKPPRPDFVSNVIPRYLYRSQALRGGTWPACESESFFRVFGQEMAAVKRPGYYAVVYFGHPAPRYITEPQRAAFGLPRESETDPEHHSAEERVVAAYNGGGLSLFWSPGYGASILAANWSPLTHHGLVATRMEGQRAWEDYSATQATIERRESSVTITGILNGTNLHYRRTYRFEDEQVRVELSITAIEPVTLKNFLEVIPFAAGKAKARGATVSPVGFDESSGTATGFNICDSTGAGLGIAFAKPQMATFKHPGLRLNDLTIDRLEIPLPNSWSAGETFTLTYVLRPRP